MIFSTTRENNPAVNILAITIISLALIVWLYFSKWVYKNQFVNILEVASLCNLCLTSIGILFEISRNGHSPAVIFTSSGIAFALFIMIVLYHTYIFKRARGALVKKVNELKIKPKEGFLHSTSQMIPDKNTNDELLLASDKPENKITSTVVELSKL